MKNKFVDTYIKIPKTSDIRKYIWAIALFINFFNYIVIIACHRFIPNSYITSDFMTTLLTYILFSFDLFSLGFFLFAEAWKKIIHVYTAISFTSCSIFYLFIACLTFIYDLDNQVTYLTIGIIILMYILIIVAVIFNIINKFKNGYNRKRINKTLAVTITSLCIFIGITIPKQPELKSMPFAIIMLILSYLFLPAISGFHKFYLVMKNIKN